MENVFGGVGEPGPLELTNEPTQIGRRRKFYCALSGR
jgi:hypothetical protein